MKHYTLDEAFEMLISNTRQWDSSRLPVNTITKLRHRQKNGKLGDQSKRNFIEKSGMFKKIEIYEFKE